MTDARFVFEPNLHLVDADAFFARDFLQAGYVMEWLAPSGVVGLPKAQTGGTNHDASVLGIDFGKNVCRVVGFDETGAVVLSDRVPDARTIWLFREKLTKAEAIGPLFERFDATLREAGHVAMSGQIVDASLIAAPRQRNTQDEKQAIREGRIPDDWKDQPAKLRQKHRDARWTVKFTTARPREDGSLPSCDVAIPVFGYQNHISIDRGFGLIRKWSATDAAAYEGSRLREGLLDKSNKAAGVWADTAYR